jgi:spectinomycin phosphotransferase
MLEKPAIPDETIIACLQAEYGLSLLQIAFLPLGGDLSTAVYRLVTQEGTPYFCKLKRNLFDPISVALPKFLCEQGLLEIIPPRVTRSGALWAVLEEFRLILYPFVEGTAGYEVELTAQQWAGFGAAMKRLHTTSIPLARLPAIRQERYSPEWRGWFRGILERLDRETFSDRLSLDLVGFLQPRREMALEALRRAQELAEEMPLRQLDFVVCHSDIHPGNLLIDGQGTLFIVDWDYPILAPKERDLMFIGGGQGFMPYRAEQEERLFYQGYGPPQIDPVALAYYRCERVVTDLTVECERILSETLGEQDRANAFETLQLYFLPGCTVEMALASNGLEGTG